MMKVLSLFYEICYFVVLKVMLNITTRYEKEILNAKYSTYIWTLEACISQNIWVLWGNRTVATYYRGKKGWGYTSALFQIYRITKMLEEKILLLHDENIVLCHSLASHGVFRWQSPLPINQELDLIPSRGTRWVYLREETKLFSMEKLIKLTFQVLASELQRIFHSHLNTPWTLSHLGTTRRMSP
jgi:hypothetical protein